MPFFGYWPLLEAGADWEMVATALLEKNVDGEKVEAAIFNPSSRGLAIDK